ncbi:MAG: hypothetical protein KF841_10280 [Phycisphaerae bacterium]|nr:hypothetical protein [Phycisphaerae bacterium]
MSDISISSSTNVNLSTSGIDARTTATTKGETAINSVTANQLNVGQGASPRPPSGDSVSGATGLETANQYGRTVGATSQSYSMTLEQVDFNKMSIFVLALLSSLFGGKEKKDDEKNNLLALLMLAGGQQPTTSKMTYYESYTTETTQLSTATSSSAVQATPYGTDTGVAPGAGGSSVGGRVDVSA